MCSPQIAKIKNTKQGREHDQTDRNWFNWLGRFKNDGNNKEWTPN